MASDGIPIERWIALNLGPTEYLSGASLGAFLP